MNVCIEFRVSSMFGQSDGACPTHRRQWADFLVSLMAPLHRHRLRAVMFCSEVPIRDTHKSPTNCLPGCGHDPRSAPNLERHGSSKMQTFGWLEMPHFLNRISRCIPSEIDRHDLPILFLVVQKGLAAQSDNPFFCGRIRQGGCAHFIWRRHMIIRKNR